MGIHIGPGGYKSTATLDANHVIIGNNEYVYDYRLVRFGMVNMQDPIFIIKKSSFKLWRK